MNLDPYNAPNAAPTFAPEPKRNAQEPISLSEMLFATVCFIVGAGSLVVGCLSVLFTALFLVWYVNYGYVHDAAGLELIYAFSLTPLLLTALLCFKAALHFLRGNHRIAITYLAIGLLIPAIAAKLLLW